MVLPLAACVGSAPKPSDVAEPIEASYNSREFYGMLEVLTLVYSNSLREYSVCSSRALALAELVSFLTAARRESEPHDSRVGY
jgi:hypothetical protein